jgi:hypothetical protein
MYFGVVLPGSTNDNISYPLATGLKDIFDSLPPGLFGLADAAYTLSECMLIPFVGADRCNPAQDAFNYYLSQLRIRVEMAFGRLVNKCGVKSNCNGSARRRVHGITSISPHDGSDSAIKRAIPKWDDGARGANIRPNRIGICCECHC